MKEGIEEEKSKENNRHSQVIGTHRFINIYTHTYGPTYVH